MRPLPPDRYALIAGMLRDGRTYAEIASALGCSRENVSQVINRRVELRRLKPRRKDTALGRLREHLEQLRLVDLEVRDLARRVRREIRDLEEEIDVGQIIH